MTTYFWNVSLLDISPSVSWDVLTFVSLCRTQAVSRLVSCWAAVVSVWHWPARCVSKDCPRHRTERSSSSKVSQSRPTFRDIVNSAKIFLFLSRWDSLNGVIRRTAGFAVVDLKICLYVWSPVLTLPLKGRLLTLAVKPGGHSKKVAKLGQSWFVLSAFLYIYVESDSPGWPRMKWVVTDTKYLTKPSKDWQPHIPTANTDTAYIEVRKCSDGSSFSFKFGIIITIRDHKQRCSLRYINT